MDFHCWSNAISFQGREFFLNFLATFLVVSVSAQTRHFSTFSCLKTHLMAAILPRCYTDTNNKVGTKRQNYWDKSHNYGYICPTPGYTVKICPVNGSGYN